LWADYRLLPGRTTNDPPDRVLAVEPLANHGSSGANVLFVDGSCEWWPVSRFLGPAKRAHSGTNGSD
jgi:prepilin-type processing-associated H-X9-DG protein